MLDSKPAITGVVLAGGRPALTRLLDGYPVEVRVDVESGRYLVAARDLMPGEIVLESLAYALSINPLNRKHW